MSADSVSEKKMIVLKSSEGSLFPIEETVALQFHGIKHIIEDGCDCAGDIIPLPIVPAPILAKVIDYCSRHSQQSETTSSNDFEMLKFDKELKIFDAEFVKVDQGTLFDLILTANYLGITGMLELTCRTAAESWKDKSPEEIQRILRHPYDSEPEEEGYNFF